MASIPLPALDIRPPENPLDTYAKALSVKSMLQGQQTQQLEQQQARLGIQQSQTALADQKAMTSAMTEWDGKDPDNLPSLVLKNGGSANAVFNVRKQLLDQKKTLSDIAAADATTNSKNLESLKTRNDQIAGSLETLTDVSDDKLPVEAKRTVNGMVADGLIDSNHAQELGAFIDSNATNPQALRQGIDHYAKMHMGYSALADQAQKSSEVYKNVQQGNLAKAEAMQKGSPLTAMEQDPTWFTPEKLPATIAYLQSKSGDTSDPVNQARATRLLGIAEVSKQQQLAMDYSKKANDQAIQDGDPIAAAKLLVDGTVAPSQIISARKPEFAQKAFTAAAQMQPGWTAQTADADFKVASSPANVAFFGSAKSLIDKGGTLDQLAAAAKDIPDGKIPVFNNIMDAAKAAAGSGPIAKYASILLGVTDDYAKVMGGGVGTDSGRTQALSLAPAQASPEQRAAAIEGIRGSVTSQLNSRIGSNPVMRKMYGDNMAPTVQKPQLQVGQQVKLKNGQIVTVGTIHPDGSWDPK